MTLLGQEQGARLHLLCIYLGMNNSSETFCMMELCNFGCYETFRRTYTAGSLCTYDTFSYLSAVLNRLHIQPGSVCWSGVTCQDELRPPSTLSTLGHLISLELKKVFNMFCMPWILWYDLLFIVSVILTGPTGRLLVKDTMFKLCFRHCHLQF